MLSSTFGGEGLFGGRFCLVLGELFEDSLDGSCGSDSSTQDRLVLLVIFLAVPDVGFRIRLVPELDLVHHDPILLKDFNGALQNLCYLIILGVEDSP